MGIRGVLKLLYELQQKDDRAVKYMTLVCSYNVKSRGKCKNAFKKHPVTKTDCTTHVCASICF